MTTESVQTSTAGVRITAGGEVFSAVLEDELAPRTCAVFRRLLPFSNKAIHARWSGEALWVPLGELDLDLTHENPTSHPAPGQVLLYPGGLSETEFLLPYGGCSFLSIVGPLAGNHFLTIVDRLDVLATLGRQVLWKGAVDLTFDFARG